MAGGVLPGAVELASHDEKPVIPIPAQRGRDLLAQASFSSGRGVSAGELRPPGEARLVAGRSLIPLGGGIRDDGFLCNSTWIKPWRGAVVVCRFDNRRAFSR